jgi:hypothetical protein
MNIVLNSLLPELYFLFTAEVAERRKGDVVMGIGKITNYQLPIPNCQLSTVNYQLSTVKGFWVEICAVAGRL